MAENLRTALDLTLTQAEAQNIAAFLGDDAESEAEAVRLLIGDGHSGYGLYVAHPDYPEEGALLVKRLPEPRGVDAPPVAIPAERPAPQHVCGLQGYNPMIDPPCQGCEARNGAWREK